MKRSRGGAGNFRHAGSKSAVWRCAAGWPSRGAGAMDLFIEKSADGPRAGQSRGHGILAKESFGRPMISATRVSRRRIRNARLPRAGLHAEWLEPQAPPQADHALGHLRSRAFPKRTPRSSIRKPAAFAFPATATRRRIDSRRDPQLRGTLIPRNSARRSFHRSVIRNCRLFDARSKWPVDERCNAAHASPAFTSCRRTFALPMFATFDAPDVMVSCPRRFQTTAPTQR